MAYAHASYLSYPVLGLVITRYAVAPPACAGLHSRWTEHKQHQVQHSNMSIKTIRLCNLRHTLLQISCIHNRVILPKTFKLLRSGFETCFPPKP